MSRETADALYFISLGLTAGLFVGMGLQFVFSLIGVRAEFISLIGALIFVILTCWSPFHKHGGYN